MDTLINFLINDFISSYIIRGIVIVIVIFYCGEKIFNFQKGHFLKIKSKKYDYIRKMYYDYDKNKLAFFFSVQEYIGLKLEEDEMDHLVKHNFYFLSERLKHAYPKIMFRYNEYHLKHPVAGPLWALLFYFVTAAPILIYAVFYREIKNSLTDILFDTLSTRILPCFIILVIVSIYNLSSLGSAKYICSYYD